MIREVSIRNKDANVATAAQNFSKFVLNPCSTAVFLGQYSRKYEILREVVPRDILSCLWTR